MSDVSASYRKRPRLRTYAERQAYYQEQAQTRQDEKTQNIDVIEVVEQKQEAAIDKKLVVQKPLPKTGPSIARWRGMWADYVDVDTAVANKILQVLDAHGYEQQRARDFVRQSVFLRSECEAGVRCKTCGEPAPVASERHGPLCVDCLLELECNIVVQAEIKVSHFGGGGGVSEPNPWQENAVRELEGN